MARVEADKVLPIQREHCPTLGRRKRKDLLVGQGLPGLAGFLDGQYVVPKPAKLLDDRKWEVLVGVQSAHLGRFVLADLLVNLIRVHANVGPGIGKIFGPQCRVAAEQIRFARPEPPRLF